MPKAGKTFPLGSGHDLGSDLKTFSILNGISCNREGISFVPANLLPKNFDKRQPFTS
jgi:hypothetical protein